MSLPDSFPGLSVNAAPPHLPLPDAQEHHCNRFPGTGDATDPRTPEKKVLRIPKAVQVVTATPAGPEHNGFRSSGIRVGWSGSSRDHMETSQFVIFFKGGLPILVS